MTILRSLAVAGILMAGVLQAPCQKISRVEAVPDDYIALLQENGYDVNAFDISSLGDRRYTITFKIKEYVDGKEVGEVLHFNPTFDNMLMVSDFDAESQAEVKPSEMDDPARGIYRLANRITVGYSPSETDSVKNVRMSVDKMGSSNWSLYLRPQTMSESGKQFYAYATRPFKADTLVCGEFIPLSLLGSFWYDEKFNIHRFCGENELSRDLSEGMTRYIPHCFIVGVEIKPREN